jgi:hypothetical protein
MPLNIKTDKLRKIINTVYDDHKADQATATCVAGIIDRTQIQIIATDESAFLLEPEDVQQEDLCIELKPVDKNTLLAVLEATVEDSDSLSLDSPEDRAALIKKLISNVSQLLSK